MSDNRAALPDAVVAGPPIPLLQGGAATLPPDLASVGTLQGPSPDLTNTPIGAIARPAPPASAAAGVGAIPAGDVMQRFAAGLDASGATPQEKATLLNYAQRESGGQNVLNQWAARGIPGPHGWSTASGPAQITDTNVKALGPGLARQLTPEDNAKIALALLRKQPNAWDESAPVGGGQAGGQAQISAAWNEAISADTAQRQAQARVLSAEMPKLIQAAESAPPGSAERMKMLEEAHEQYQKATEAFQNLMAHPPTEKPVDAVQNFGSVVTLLAGLAGLKSRAPLTASLGAMGAAMQGLNQQNHQQFENAFETWKMQTDYGLKLVGMQGQDIRNILEDERMSWAEKQAQFGLLDKAYGLQGQLAGLAATNPELLAKRADAITRSVEDAQRQANMLTMLGIRLGAQPKAAQQQEVDAAVARDDADYRAKNPQATTSELAEAHTKNYEARTREITSASGLGRQQAQQLTAITSAGNEAVAALNNLVELPITANMGAFGGAQYRTPDDLSAALRRSLARSVTPEEVSELRASFAGVQRSLATLEAAGRATGLVGLSEQMNALIPQSGDTPLVVLRKYAEIRQIIERSMETVKSTGAVPPTQTALLDKISDEAKKAVPFTVHDVNLLERGPHDPGTVKAFAERVFANRGGQASPKAGDVQDGYRFKGGDPANPTNWEKAP